MHDVTGELTHSSCNNPSPALALSLSCNVRERAWSRDNCLCTLIILASFLAMQSLLCMYDEIGLGRKQKGIDGGHFVCVVSKKKIIFPEIKKIKIKI